MTATALERHRLPRRTYTVAGQPVTLRQVVGGYTAEHDCPKCNQGRPCHRALAAVDAEGTERYLAECQIAYETAKRAMAR